MFVIMLDVCDIYLILETQIFAMVVISFIVLTHPEIEVLRLIAFESSSQI